MLLTETNDELDLWAKLQELEGFGEIMFNESEKKLMEQLGGRTPQFSVTPEERQQLLQMWNKYIGE